MQLIMALGSNEMVSHNKKKAAKFNLNKEKKSELFIYSDIKIVHVKSIKDPFVFF